MRVLQNIPRSKQRCKAKQGSEKSSEAQTVRHNKSSPIEGIWISERKFTRVGYQQTSKFILHFVGKNTKRKGVIDLT